MEVDRGPLDDSLRRSRGAVLTLTGVARTFDRRAALLPLNLQVRAGEFVSLLGPSGSGKSTLLKIMAGLETPDQGQLTTTSNRTSFVFQDAALLPWRSALANVALPLELMGIAKSQSRAQAREALNQVGLSNALDLYPNQLSGGMRMRVSVARAIVSEPSLLLLDEPFAALDERTRFRLQEDLRKLWLRLRMTTIFVTHSVAESVFVSNRAIVLSNGPGQILLDRTLALGDERLATLRAEPRFLEEVATLNSAFESSPV